MIDNRITLDCPICGPGNTMTTTTDTDTTTSTTADANAPATNPKVEHTTSKSTARVTASSASIQHAYDLTGYQIPVQVEGIVQGNRRLPIEVEAILPVESGAFHSNRTIHAVTMGGVSLSEAREKQGKDVKKDPLSSPRTFIFNCPVKQQLFQATLVRENRDGPITIIGGEAISPDNSILLDVGKQIASDSLKVSSSFCTSMISTSTGAIGVYTALFAIVLPKTCTIGIVYGLFAILPALVFLIAAVGFAYGAFPIHGSFMAADPYSVEVYRDSLFSLRRRRLLVSFLLFCLAMALAVIIIVLVTATHVGCSA